MDVWDKMQLVAPMLMTMPLCCEFMRLCIAYYSIKSILSQGRSITLAPCLPTHTNTCLLVDMSILALSLTKHKQGEAGGKAGGKAGG